LKKRSRERRKKVAEMAEKKKKEEPKKKQAVKEEKKGHRAKGEDGPTQAGFAAKASHKAGTGKPTEKVSLKVGEKPVKEAGKGKGKDAEKEKPGKGDKKKVKEDKGKKGKEKAEEKKGKEDKKKLKKKFKKPKKPAIKKSKQVKKLSELVRAKKRRMFRGRFGKRGSVRKISNKKWQKWRKPRGLDIYFKKEDGLVPRPGYGTAKKIRFVHPSGYRERLVRNMQELLSLEKDREKVAARVSGKIGLKKKIEMLKKADKLKIVVLNR
jgi:large subunit ribosomal protein L32e